MGTLLPGGWTALMKHNQDMALAARQRLCQTLRVQLPCPDTMIGSMATIPLLNGSAKSLQTQLFQQFRIEVPIIPWSTPNRLIRLSAQLYNTMADYDGLAKSLVELLATELKEA